MDTTTLKTNAKILAEAVLYGYRVTHSSFGYGDAAYTPSPEFHCRFCQKIGFDSLEEDDPGVEPKHPINCPVSVARRVIKALEDEERVATTNVEETQSGSVTGK